MIRPQFILDINDELVVALFAGAGGWCHAFERATGRHVDIACNHAEDALSCHQVNHPQTKHFCCSVFELSPRQACAGRPVAILHLSPDCTHFSQASAGQPRDKKIRSLVWVALWWAGTVKPRVISIENVKQIRKWGPLIAKRCKTTGRVVKVDGTVAEPGERVPVQQQFLVPDPKREGQSWRHFNERMSEEGYPIQEDSDIVAARWGAATTRDRLCAMYRSDSRQIVWPVPTHFKKPRGRLKKWKPAADCIDWGIPVPSIFERKRELVRATCERLATGVMDFAVNHPDPFIVPLTHHGQRKVHSVSESFPTITGAHRGELALAVPMVAPICQYNRGNIVRSGADPFGTMTSYPKGGHYALATAFIAQHNGGKNETPGHDARAPFSTIVGRATQQQLVTAASGELPWLSPEQEAGAFRVAAFLMRYYSSGGQWGDLRNPMPAVTTKDRMALVTVTIHGIRRVIWDIGMRMFTARELFNGMGFLPSFIIDRGHDGRKFTKTTQVRLVGNAVSPPPFMAIIQANVPELCRFEPGEMEAIA